MYSSCVTPAGTSNELDVQNGWEENTHTHTVVTQGRSIRSGRNPPLYCRFSLNMEMSRFTRDCQNRLARPNSQARTATRDKLVMRWFGPSDEEVMK